MCLNPARPVTEPGYWIPAVSISLAKPGVSWPVFSFLCLLFNGHESGVTFSRLILRKKTNRCIFSKCRTIPLITAIMSK